MGDGADAFGFVVGVAGDDIVDVALGQSVEVVVLVDERVGLAIRGDDHAGDAVSKVVGVADGFAAAREPAQSPDDVVQAREAGAVGVAGGEWSILFIRGLADDLAFPVDGLFQ